MKSINSKSIYAWGSYAFLIFCFALESQLEKTWFAIFLAPLSAIAIVIIFFNCYDCLASSDTKIIGKKFYLITSLCCLLIFILIATESGQTNNEIMEASNNNRKVALELVSLTCKQKLDCERFNTARQQCATAGNINQCMSIKTKGLENGEELAPLFCDQGNFNPPIHVGELNCVFNRAWSSLNHRN
jgi:hypothetical protein